MCSSPERVYIKALCQPVVIGQSPLLSRGKDFAKVKIESRLADEVAKAGIDGHGNGWVRTSCST